MILNAFLITFYVTLPNPIVLQSSAKSKKMSVKLWEKFNIFE